jgi:hypothetical protein
LEADPDCLQGRRRRDNQEELGVNLGPNADDAPDASARAILARHPLSAIRHAPSANPDLTADPTTVPMSLHGFDRDPLRKAQLRGELSATSHVSPNELTTKFS